MAMNIVETPRHRTLAVIAKALKAGDTVPLGEFSICYREQDALIEEQGLILFARRQGVYLRMPTYSGRDRSTPDHYTWGYAAPLSDLPALVSPYLDAMNVCAREQLVVGLVHRNAMREMSREAPEVEMLVDEPGL